MVSWDNTSLVSDLIPVMGGLEGAGGLDAEVLRLLVGEFGQLHAERLEVQ